MAASDICRLCLSPDNLVWIFDQRIACPNNMKDVIFITTGVEILVTDVISQKVCSKCCQITIKMFKFRTTALKNDKDLKVKYTSQIRSDILKSNVEIKQENDDETPVENQWSHEHCVSRPVPFIHPSVTKLFVSCPGIKLPSGCLGLNLSPRVVVRKYVYKGNIEETTSNIDRKPKTERKKDIKVSSNVTLRSPDVKQFLPGKCITSKETEIKYIDNIKNSAKIQNSYGLNELKPESISVFTQKRKIESTECAVSEKIPKLNEQNPIIESLGLTPTAAHKGLTEQNPLSYIEKSIPVLICEVCNRPFGSLSSLTIHRKKAHLKCQFCKSTFKSILNKNLHVDKHCEIRNMMNHLPNVYLDKIELDLEIRQKFPNAFIGFESLPQMENTNPNKIACVNDIETYCISDDENTNSREIEPPRNIKLSDLLTTSEGIPTQLKSTTNDVVDKISNSKLNIPETSDTTNKQQSKKTNKEENVSSISIVKPEIKIKSDDILNKIDSKGSDIKIMKELLGLVKTALPTTEPEIDPANLPSNQDIIINRTTKYSELRNLKHHLNTYKIPVEIKNGKFNVTYSVNNTPMTFKKRYLWNDLRPVDIVEDKVSAPLIVKTGNQTLNAVKLAAPKKTDVENTQKNVLYIIQSNVQTTTKENVTVNNNSAVPASKPSTNLSSSITSNPLLNSLVGQSTSPPVLVCSKNQPVSNATQYNKPFTPETPGLVLLSNSVLTKPAQQRTDPILPTSSAAPHNVAPSIQAPAPAIRVKNVWELK